MIRILVSGLVVAVSGFATLAAALNSAMYGVDAETLFVGGAYAILLVLGLWSARGSRLGALLLAGTLLVGALAIVVATRNENIPASGVVTSSHQTRSRWRVPVVMSIRGSALLCDRWLSRRSASGPQNNEMQRTSHG